MNKFLRICRQEIAGNTLFSIFDAIYLFGSSLYSVHPEDIDILLIYADGKKTRDIENIKNKMLSTLSSAFNEGAIHFVTLSRAELKQTKFLGKTKFQRIK